LRSYPCDDPASASHEHDNDDDDDDDDTEEKKEANGAVMSPTTTATAAAESEMRGVHAKRFIPPNTVCMSIPRRCLITVEMGQATEIGRIVMAADLDLDAPKHIYLMIYLLWDRKVNQSNSFYYPYYEVLPQTLSNMPIFWTAEELAELRGSFLLHQIADRKRAISSDYEAICRVAPEFEEICSLTEFQWARMCVCSRNFGLQMDGHRTSAMVPHADMLNHYRPRETKWTFDCARQAFTITSLQGICEGAEVLDSYGQKCNHRFLLNYGFAVENNRELDGFCPNEVPITLHCNRPTEFWLRSDPSPTKRIRVCVSNNESTRLLFSLLRSLELTDAELQLVRAMTRAMHPQYHTSIAATAMDIRHPVSIRNERAALKHLIQVIRKQQAAYPTTLDDDIRLLEHRRDLYPLFSNKRHAKIQVKGEKEVLEHYLDWAATGLQVLDIIEAEVNDPYNATNHDFDYTIRRMDMDERVHHTVLRYCEDVLGSLRREELKKRRQQR
jgi:protein-histidine N-methyltransferase